MSLRDAIDKSTARLASVPGTKNVYSYARAAKDQESFAELFRDPTEGNIHTWMVTRDGTKTVAEEAGAYSRTHTIAMMGYMSVQDALDSEGTFQDLVEAICAAFDPLTARQYGGAFDWSSGLNVEGPTVLMYGAVMCHAVKLTQEIREYPLI